MFGPGFELGYMFWSGNTSNAPTFQLRLGGWSFGTGLEIPSVTWDPGDNGGFQTSKWETRTNLQSAQGQWRVSHSTGGVSPGGLATLRQIADANPNAYIMEYGVVSGNLTGNLSGTKYADGVRYGCTNWDFEPGLFNSGSFGSG